MRNFFYDNRVKSYEIKDSILDIIRNLKSCVTESGYYEYMVNWDMTGQKNVEDIWITMQFLSMTAKPKQHIIDKYNLGNKKYLINLMRQLYLDIDDSDADTVVLMGYKKPFGNSHVLGDVREELKNCGEDYESYEYTLENEVLKEFSEFIADFFADGFESRWYSFDSSDQSIMRYQEACEKWQKYDIEQMHSFLLQWLPGKSEIRDIKISEILNN